MSEADPSALVFRGGRVAAAVPLAFFSVWAIAICVDVAEFGLEGDRVAGSPLASPRSKTTARLSTGSGSYFKS